MMGELRVNPKTNMVLVDKTLAAKAANIIRDKIISGEYPMGSRLLEVEFAKAMGISRASVREAFMILENNGLLERHANKATLVVNLHARDVEDLYHLRAAIEVACLERCIRENLLDVNAMSHLSQSIADSFQGRKETEYRRSIRWIEADMEFHQLLVATADNLYASKVWRTLKHQTLLLLNFAAKVEPANVVPMGDDGAHETLLQLIVERNSTDACSFLKRHILAGGQRVKAIIATRETPSV